MTDPVSTLTSDLSLGDLLISRLAPWCANLGTGPADPRLLAWMLPNDSRAWVAAYLGKPNAKGEYVSTCALVVLTLWIYLHVEGAEGLKYVEHPEMAVALVGQIAERSGAKVPPTRDVDEGDVIVTAVPHVCAVESDDGDGVTVLQGGGPGVHRSSPKWGEVNGRLTLGGHEVLYVVRTSSLRTVDPGPDAA